MLQERIVSEDAIIEYTDSLIQHRSTSRTPNLVFEGYGICPERDRARYAIFVPYTPLPPINSIRSRLSNTPVRPNTSNSDTETPIVAEDNTPTANETPLPPINSRTRISNTPVCPATSNSNTGTRVVTEDNTLTDDETSLTTIFSRTRISNTPVSPDVNNSDTETPVVTEDDIVTDNDSSEKIILEPILEPKKPLVYPPRPERPKIDKCFNRLLNKFRIPVKGTQPRMNRSTPFSAKINLYQISIQNH